MIRLFRKIRHKLLSENSYGIYVLYATGEIFLVVIGILLALQIDNWNDNRKLKDLEISTLEEFVTALEQDTTLLGQAIVNVGGHIEAGSYVISALEDRVQFDSLLGYKIADAYRSTTDDPVNITAFDLLNERGTDIISNGIIRRAITQHYTIKYKQFSTSIEGLKSIHRIEAQNIYGNVKYIADHEGQMIIIPDSFEALCDNNLIINAFYHFRQMAQAKEIRISNYYTLTVNLLQDIKDEISRLSS